MEVHAVELVAEVGGWAAEIPQPAAGGEQEDGLAAGGVEYLRLGVVADRPVGQVVGDGRWGEERSSGLPEREVTFGSGHHAAERT